MVPVGESWTRIVDWLGQSAPATAAALGAGVAGAGVGEAGVGEAGVSASVEALADAEHAVGRPLPPDLVEWWLIADGLGDEPLIPMEHAPLAIARALEARRSRLDRHVRLGESIVDGEAGRPSRGFQSAFVPIATDHRGRLLFVDLRDGPVHGCVAEWDDVASFADAIRWPSVAEMLGDIADALEHGVPAMTFHAAGRLRHFADHPEAPIGTCRAAVTPSGHLTWATWGG